ncbi:MAG: amidohydrolase [Phycisphaerales bacterium]|nr:amidohydrolase [Phycisphaerales bacterium]
MTTIKERVQAILPTLIEIRHDIHAHPELGYQETRTASVIRSFLEEREIDFAGNLAGGTGTLAHIGGESNKAVGLRADIDALPITEENTFDYISTHEGCMHACGHDGHTTMLLGTAAILADIAKEAPLPNSVSMLFQPAEEGGGGGKKMVEDGCLDGSVIGPPIAMMFGQHGWSELPLGHVSTRVGPMLAADIGINATIRGKGGHAAFPHTCIDPIVCGAQVVSSLQQLVSRHTDPLDALVCSITQFHSGTTHNIIPDEVKLNGTMRYLQKETGEMAAKRFKEIVEGVAAAHGCEADVDLKFGYPVTKNHEDAVATFFDIANRTIEGTRISEFDKPVMGGEDFSYYCEQVPSCFFALGLLPDGQERMPNLHSPHFDFNDDALATGVEMFCELALQTSLD